MVYCPYIYQFFMNIRFIQSLFALCLISLLVAPPVAMAAPLAGADADVVYVYKGMMSYQDETTDANDADSAGDVSWPESQTKSAFIGHQTSQFSGVVVDVSSATFSTGQDLFLTYYNGSSWSPLTITAETRPFDSTGVNSVSFTVPGDWVKTTVYGVEAYWISTSTSAYNSNDGRGSSGASVSQISVVLAGGGGAEVPEFSDMLYVAVLLAGGAYLVQKQRAAAL